MMTNPSKGTKLFKWCIVLPIMSTSPLHDQLFKMNCTNYIYAKDRIDAIHKLSYDYIYSVMSPVIDEYLRRLPYTKKLTIGLSDSRGEPYRNTYSIDIIKAESNPNLQFNPNYELEVLYDIMDSFYRVYGKYAYRCVNVSKELSDYLNKIGIENKFVWADVGKRYMYGPKTPMHYEHSWVEVKVGNKWYVIDITGPAQFEFRSPFFTRNDYYKEWDWVKPWPALRPISEKKYGEGGFLPSGRGVGSSSFKTVRAELLKAAPKYEQNEDIPELKYWVDTYDYHHGQLDGSVYADDKIGNRYGKLNFAQMGSNTYIQFITVAEKFRRHGIAVAMIKKLREEFPDTSIKWTATTESGEGLRQAWIHKKYEQNEVYVKKGDIVPYSDWGTIKYKHRDTAYIAEPHVDIKNLNTPLYHATNNLPAIMQSGYLRAGGGTESGGLGGGRSTRAVSFTTNLDDAKLIVRELVRMGEIARGDESLPALITRYAAEDEDIMGLYWGALTHAANYSINWWKEYFTGKWYKKADPIRLANLRKDAYNSYLNGRESKRYDVYGDERAKTMVGPKNPIFFGFAESFMNVTKERCGIVVVNPRSIPDDVAEHAYAHYGPDTFLSEFRIYADVPLYGAQFLPAKTVYEQNPRYQSNDRLEDFGLLNEPDLAVDSKWSTNPELKWGIVDDALKPKLLETMFELIAVAYGRPEHVWVTKEDLMKEYNNWYVGADNGKVKAVLMWKTTPFGNKMVTNGHDGSDVAKKSSIQEMHKLLKIPGFYAEASGSIERVLVGEIPPLPIPIVKILLYDKPIKPAEDGYHYTRLVAGKKEVQKVMVGLPKITPFVERA